MQFIIFAPMLKFKLDRFFMFMATIAMALNLFGHSLVIPSIQLKSSSTETTIKEIKNHNLLDQSRFEEIDLTETEEDHREESSGPFDLNFKLTEVFKIFYCSLIHPNLASSSPFLKPLHFKEVPLFLLLQNIRV